MRDVTIGMAVGGKATEGGREVRGRERWKGKGERQYIVCVRNFN